jgi:hypothetical protein
VFWLEVELHDLADAQPFEPTLRCGAALAGFKRAVNDRLGQGISRDSTRARSAPESWRSKKTAPELPRKSVSHRTALATAAQPRPASPGPALPSRLDQPGFKFGRLSRVNIRSRLTMAFLCADRLSNHLLLAVQPARWFSYRQGGGYGFAPKKGAGGWRPMSRSWSRDLPARAAWRRLPRGTP